MDSRWRCLLRRNSPRQKSEGRLGASSVGAQVPSFQEVPNLELSPWSDTTKCGLLCPLPLAQLLLCPPGGYPTTVSRLLPAFPQA